MPAGLSLAIALLAEVAAPTYGPVQPAPAKPPAKAPAATVTSAEGCGPVPATAEPGEIFVCAPRPEGYRLNPDVMEAKRALRNGRPKRPERMKDNSCASVGPMACGPAGGIDLLGAAMTLGTMAAKAARGENVGNMFITDPRPTEYELYVEAKRRREAKEAEAAAAAKVKGGRAPPSEERDPGEDE